MAIQYALAYPGNINRMILSNPAMLSREYDQDAANITKAKTTRDDSVARAELMGSGKMDLKKYERFFLLSFKASSYDPANLKNLNLNLPSNFSDASKALFSSLMKDPAQQDNLYNDLAKLPFPVLIIHGQADVVPPASITRLKEGLPKATVEVFTRSGHFPFIEEPEKYAQIVTKFLIRK